jgi:adenine-specific DNA-methyltransferase
MPTVTTTITDSRFTALKAKLRELFELDKSDLDFGIYRIMAAKNKEVTDFLDRQLKEAVRQTLAEHGAGAVDQVEAEIAKARKAAEDAGFNSDESPRVRELEARLASAGRGSAAELEADIYNHLLAFFGRYYDEGDFISQRRYKGDTYAIPYSGEEVTLHWANKDQYYIKSGEWHKDYRFKLADGRRVRFALVDATQETGNNKEPDEAKRRYILVDDQSVVAEGDTLTLRFHFRAPTETERQRAGDGAVAIFGGKYASGTKGDEREQFCADAEKRALPHIPDGWRSAVTAAAATETKPARTLLGKHLDAFTARNTFDYFIHKDLGGFLRRELDFYIKNEVVRLDDLDAAPPDHLQRVQGRVRAIRRVASKVIDLLASLEDFQKKLWLKKKFVLNTSWLVTVDRVPSKLRDVVAANEKQWAEWVRLGFKPEGDAAENLFGGAEWGTRAYLDACDKLVVDTRLFDSAFTSEMLASEEVNAGMTMLDDRINHTLVNGDNFGALRLLSDWARGQVSVTYIDPPYNTERDRNEGKFIYKDGYCHSSWSALFADRVVAAQPFLRATDFAFFVSLDENELPNATKHLPFAKLHGFFTWRRTRTGGHLSRSFNQLSDYVLVFTAPEGSGSWLYGGRADPDESQPLTKKTNAISRLEFPAGTLEFLDLPTGTIEAGRYSNGVVVVPNPIRVEDGKNADAIRLEAPFTWQQSMLGSELKRGARMIVKRHANMNVRFLREAEGHKPLPSLADGSFDVGTNEDASSLLCDVLGREFPGAYPKPVRLIERLVQTKSEFVPDVVVLDYFAGTGTTGHALVNMNRADGQNRRGILVEMGSQFEEVMRPRLAKTVFSPDWKDGEAQTHDQGLSALVKCFAVESYEDALNNLPPPAGGMFDGRPAEESDTLIRYALDLELGPHLLDLDIFRDPWGHTINAQLAGDDEIRRHKVDLVETFNYLLGCG